MTDNPKGRVPDFTKYPLRTCRSLHGCAICKSGITLGQRYYDGGYGRRAHDLCGDADAMERLASEQFVAATKDFYANDGDRGTGKDNSNAN